MIDRHLFADAGASDSTEGDGIRNEALGDRVSVVADAMRAISSSTTEAAVHRSATSSIGRMFGRGVEVRIQGEQGSSGMHFAMKDCAGSLRGYVVVECDRMDLSTSVVVETIAAQAGLMIGCLSMQTSSVRAVAARQVAEFEASRLKTSFNTRLEEALGERSVWADVFRGSQYSVCIVSHDLRYVSFNDAFQEWFTRHGDIVPSRGQHVRDALSLRPEVATMAESHWKRALAGRDFTHCWELEAADGLFHYETRYAPLRSPDGEISGAVQFSLDVSDRVRERKHLEEMESALRQSQKMEAVGKLTGGIAHDFNNLLTGIVGSLDIIARKMSKGQLEAVPRYIDMATTSVNRAASLTNRLLAFSRKHPVDPRVTDVEALILGMEEMLSRTMGPDIIMEVSTSGMSSRVMCDSSQLESALMSLAVNAREAMSHGGRLLISSDEVDLDDVTMGEERHSGRCVRIVVSDTGCGMTPEVVQRAVEPFFTTKGIGQGTGLGLSMAYGFAQQSGGYLDIKSAPGEGATISIYLPSMAASMVPVEQSVTTSCKMQDATVLVVEDEPAIRMLVVEMLEEMGCRVIEAQDGGEGASILSGDIEIDMLVTDIGLPVLNGRQVATVARTSRPSLPILFITGYSENATITDGFAGRTMLLTKPFRPGQMAEAVTRMLE